MQKTDITTARHKDVYATAITDMFPKRLKISKDGHLTLLFDSLAAKGTWKVNGPGIDVEFQEVSGMSMEAAKASIEKWKSLDDYERRRHQGWQELDFLVSAAESIKRLELDKDQKRLFDPTSVREDGTTFMGTKTWERQGK